ncbi:hypothetical protein [Piscinibacter sakaiensis]|uniref:Oxidoreductase n=1 Tax=Piscinibacter sakaiensis TaxID=1547922 RepID=A0A0K8P4L8_PISS1|nr:hypothetical protein [Piscinibacter sakaiensis]GAP37618.1 oxidoreductase [Piscinibacter sakaiensis]
MDLHVTQALRAGRAAAPAPPAPGQHALVAGGAGALGAAVLERLLGRGGFGRVRVLVEQPLAAHLRGLEPLRWQGAATALPDGPLTTAVLVLDRGRHANGREAAFWRPRPEDLPAFAGVLHAAGVRRLLVVTPQATALPQALRHGLASLDEQAVAALGFERLVFMRPAQAGAAERAARAPERLAQWLLSQLRVMVPQREQPVRAAKVAAFAAELAHGLANAPPGTRVVPAEQVWEAAQAPDTAAAARAWLAGSAIGHATVALPRM